MRTLLFALFPLAASAAGPAAGPCTDFYEYACGSWMASHPIPADKARYGRFDELQDRNERVLLDILQGAAAKGAGRSAIEQKIGDHYKACMDTAAIEKKGLEALRPELERIAAMSQGEDIMPEIARLHSLGVGVVFSFGASPDLKDSNRTIASIGQGGLAMPDRDYYLKTDPKSVEIRQKYEAHAARVYKLLGLDAAQAPAAAKMLLEFETVIARASMDRVSLRDPAKRHHPMSRTQLAALDPEIAWEDYFSGVGAPAFDALNVSSYDFVKTLSADLRAQPLEAWKAYLSYHLVENFSTELPAAIDKEMFDFHRRTIGGYQEQRERSKRCAAAVDNQLGDLLGQKYVEIAFGAASREQIDTMVDALEKALDKDIRALPWMSEETKKAAVAKLRAITNNVGMPKKWRDYGSVEIRPDDYLGNVQRIARFERKRNLDKIGKPTDRSEWRMSAPTVNAFYSPQHNSINFPAGIMQPPFFDARRDIAANFGGIGAVIGHELTHGFDDSGRKFDGAGNLRDWWTAQDAKEFEKRSACVVDQYASYTAVDDVKLNGKLTLGENVADHGGLRIALMALLDTLGGKAEKIDGMTPEQRFFLGFAQVWCQNMRPEQARARALADPHSPGRYRVNGTVQNMPEFQKAFSCSAGQPMVSANACRVW